MTEICYTRPRLTLTRGCRTELPRYRQVELEVQLLHSDSLDALGVGGGVERKGCLDTAEWE